MTPVFVAPPLAETKEGGRPTHSRNHSSTSSSSFVGPADSIHEPAYTLHAPAMKSPSAAVHVPAKGTNAKKRGWSPRLMNGSTSSVRRRSSSSNGTGPEGGGPDSRARISAGVARRSGGADA